MPRSARPSDPEDLAREGWESLSDAARRLGLDRSTLSRWCRRGLVPSRRWGKLVLVPPDVAAALARSWRCPACAFEAAGPEGLAGHVRALHGEAGGPRSEGWGCPATGCARGRRPLTTSEALAQHLTRHVEELARGGVAERRSVGRPRRESPRPTCKAKGCNGPSVAHGLCMTHYQAARRAKAKRKT